MSKRMVVAVLVVTCLGVLAASVASWAATDQQTLTINATVSSQAKLELGVATIHFPAADPDGTPSILATENPVSVTVKAHSGSSQPVTLTVQANGDLQSGGNSIPITKVTWTAAGSGFISGTMDTSSQPAGSWTGSGRRDGTFSYSLANDWAYQAGSYSQTVVYTLTAP